MSQTPGRVIKRSVNVAGHATSVSLEAAFWDGLRAMVSANGLSLAAQIAAIDAARGEANLSSAIRVAVLLWTRRSGQGAAG